MQIFWHGYSTIRIESKNGDLSSVIMTDPFENEAAIRFPRATEPDILLLSNQNRKNFNIEGVAGSPFLISDPGEYEVKGAFVNGIQDPKADEGDKRPLMYRIDVEGMSIAFLGQAKRKPTDMELEELGNIDILILPVGGGDVMDAKTAASVINMVEPRIVIPIHYYIDGIKTELGKVKSFCDAVGGSKQQEMNKLKITKKELPADDVAIMVIERT
ncbi:MAG: MBL fold metallo-hydrolase [Patescibacteria group bacterium]|nr:MBL fold metallo-hydrolase [Patescibacteria group bacterium]